MITDAGPTVDRGPLDRTAAELKRLFGDGTGLTPDVTAAVEGALRDIETFPVNSRLGFDVVNSDGTTVRTIVASAAIHRVLHTLRVARGKPALG